MATSFKNLCRLIPFNLSYLTLQPFLLLRVIVLSSQFLGLIPKYLFLYLFSFEDCQLNLLSTISNHSQHIIVVNSNQESSYTCTVFHFLF